MIKKVLFFNVGRTFKKTDERFTTERVDGRDKLGYNRSASIGIIRHFQSDNKNPRRLDVVGCNL